jgi:RNA-binding protein YhbY
MATLLDHLEKVVVLTDKKGLTDSYFEKADKHIKAVSKTLKVSKMQAVIFAHFMNLCDDQSIIMHRIAQSIKCSKIQLVKFMDEFDELEKKKLIRCKRNINDRHGSSDMPSYRVPMEVINAVRKGIEYRPEKRANLTIEAFFAILENIFFQRTSGELSFQSFLNDLRDLANDNPDLIFVQRIKWYKFDYYDAILFYRFCDLFVNEDDDGINTRQLDDIFEDSLDFHHIERSLKNGDHNLMEIGLVENVNNDGMANTEYFRLTDKAKEEFLSELNISEKLGKRGKDFILAADIKEKILFFNDRETEQVKELNQLLQDENFTEVQGRLAGSGLRKGFACLFHGAPGTGKTETVYQLGRETGRDIMVVDISETKSMWFGESEKRIKRVFDRYKGVIKSGGLTPILLFNEADAVIGKRRELGASRSGPDQTENAIQNIILQEIENLDGILIATTNLTKNMDKAFERRFLYKIEFEKPNQETRQTIWKSVIPDLTDGDYNILAEQFNFSGGQIENVSRKRTINSILTGTKPSLETLISYCRDELINETEGAKTIGFTA